MCLIYVISIALSESITSLPFRYEEKSIFLIQLTETSIRCYHCTAILPDNDALGLYNKVHGHGEGREHAHGRNW